MPHVRFAISVTNRGGCSYIWIRIGVDLPATTEGTQMGHMYILNGCICGDPSNSTEGPLLLPTPLACLIQEIKRLPLPSKGPIPTH